MNLDRLRRNFAGIRSHIQQTCESVNRDPSDLTLVVVTKNRPPELIREALKLDVSDIGENRVHEAVTKKPDIPEGPRWHMVGRLQSNKAKKALETFDVIHSIDRPSLARELQRQLNTAGRTLEVFVQVNVAGEEQKSGVKPENALPFVDLLRDRYKNLSVIGLMTMAPVTDDPEKVRWIFSKLRELSVRCRVKGLSMGMTQDYAVAIEEGATHLRIGSAFFDGVLDAEDS